MTPDELLDDLKIPYAREGDHHHARPGWVQIKDCPFCSSSNYHLGLNLAGGFFACWKCGGHHPAKVWKALGASLDVLKGITRSKVLRRERTKGELTTPPSVGPMGEAHEDYLRSRGLDPEEMARIWGIKGIGVAPRLAWRLFIPIDFENETVSWTTRTVGNSPQRYISASEKEEALPHKTLVYGQDYCSHSIIICEGPGDAWKIGPGAGALFGTAYTPSQVQRLIKHPYRYIVFDASYEAQKKAEELANQLAVFPGETIRVELDAEDPGSASDDEIRRLRRAAKID